MPMRLIKWRAWTPDKIDEYLQWKKKQIAQYRLWQSGRTWRSFPIQEYSIGRRGLPEISIYDAHNQDDYRYQDEFHNQEHPQAFTVQPRLLRHKPNAKGWRPESWNVEDEPMTIKGTPALDFSVDREFPPERSRAVLRRPAIPTSTMAYQVDRDEQEEALRYWAQGHRGRRFNGTAYMSKPPNPGHTKPHTLTHPSDGFDI